MPFDAGSDTDDADAFGLNQSVLALHPVTAVTWRPSRAASTACYLTREREGENYGRDDD